MRRRFPGRSPGTAPKRPGRWPVLVAWTLGALVLLPLPAVRWADHLLRQAGRPDLVQWATGPALAGASAAVVGAVVASRRPRHPVGWLLLAFAWALVATGAAAQYLAWGVARPGMLPAARYAALLYPASAYMALILLCFVLLLTPTGSLPSPRWRWWARAVAAIPTVLLVVGARAPGSVDPYHQLVAGPFDLHGLGGVRLVANQVALAVTDLAVLVAAGSLVVRFRRARGTERQQLRWVALAASLMMLAAAVTLAALAMGAPAVPDWVPEVSVVVLPLAIGAAILRYRLYDLDRIISRTLAYSLLTLLLGGGYAAVVLGLGQLLGRQSTLVVAGATLVVAAAFQPARRRIQQIVDRRFNRRRYDAARTIEAFDDRLRQQIDLDALTAELLTVVDQTMQPTCVLLWLRPTTDGQSPARPAAPAAGGDLPQPVGFAGE
jgi:N-terminal 7TM region of histidine kinase